MRGTVNIVLVNYIQCSCEGSEWRFLWSYHSKGVFILHLTQGNCLFKARSKATFNPEQPQIIFTQVFDAMGYDFKRGKPIRVYDCVAWKSVTGENSIR